MPHVLGVAMIGARFGRLLVTARVPKVDQYASISCVCDCGAVFDVRGAHMTAQLGHRPAVALVTAPRFKTIQVCPKDRLTRILAGS
jgi:hypothetical protein